MRAAGVRQFGNAIETLDLPEPRALRPDWPQRVRALTNGGVDAAANAVPTGASEAMKTVRDGGRLATITSDPPPADRHITVRAVLVAPDGRRLSGLLRLLAQGALTVRVGEQFPLEQAAAALTRVRCGAGGSAIVLLPRGPVPG